jgi:hypothetical protein
MYVYFWPVFRIFLNLELQKADFPLNTHSFRRVYFYWINVLIFLYMLQSCVLVPKVHKWMLTLFFWNFFSPSPLTPPVWSVQNLLNQRIFFDSCGDVNEKIIFLSNQRLWYVLNIAKIANLKILAAYKNVHWSNKLCNCTCQFFSLTLL